jgi:hypothetical protein
MWHVCPSRGLRVCGCALISITRVCECAVISHMYGYCNLEDNLHVIISSGAGDGRLRSWRESLRRHQTHMDGSCNPDDTTMTTMTDLCFIYKTNYLAKLPTRVANKPAWTDATICRKCWYVCICQTCSSEPAARQNAAPSLCCQGTEPSTHAQMPQSAYAFSHTLHGATPFLAYCSDV